MGQVLHWGLSLGWELVGVETSINKKVGWFSEGDRGGFGKDVLD